MKSHFTIVQFVLFSVIVPAMAQEKKTFTFDVPADGAVQVAPDAMYSAERGHGFDLATKRSPANDQPFYFSAALPEGNYKVTVALGDAKADSVTTVNAETHRLMLEQIAVPAGKTETRSFIVNIRTPKINPPIPQNAPGRPEVTLSQFEARNGGGLTWDDKLTLEFSGAHPAVHSVTIEKADATIPTVYIAGDSTVTDQAGASGHSWGQALTRFLGPDVAVANYAESGETMKSFMSALRLDKLLSQMKKGDYLLIQFGHNDSKASWPQTYVEAKSTYKAYLKVYIAEARRRGATPVIINPMQRRGFTNDGKVRNSHGEYPEAVREVAKEENVAFIDLTAMSEKLYEAFGPDKSASLFNDATHHSPFGAYELAKCIAQGIIQNKLDLANHLSSDFKGFDPAKPDKFEDYKVPVSTGGNRRAPTTIMGS